MKGCFSACKHRQVLHKLTQLLRFFLYLLLISGLCFQWLYRLNRGVTLDYALFSHFCIAKSQHEFYVKLSEFHSQFRMVGNRSNFVRFACKELQPDIEGTEEPLFRAQNRSIGVQVREVYDAVSADYA